MTTAREIADYIASQMHVLGETQVQKLTYYAQAWSLAWDGQPLFDESIEAWKNGPVTPSLRYVTFQPDPGALSGPARATVDAIIEFYGKHHGSALGDMTHEELPWQEAWEKRPKGSMRCNEPVSHDTMREFYSAKVLDGAEVPVRTPVYEAVSDEVIANYASAEAARWRETLVILSR